MKTGRIPSFALLAACVLAWGMLTADAEILDCRTASAGEFAAAFNELSYGLEYNDDGEIVRSPGKRLQNDEATRVAFMHYIDRHNPTVSITVSRTCRTCNGVARRVSIEGREGANLGYGVERICGACVGRGSYTENAVVKLVYSGELPKKRPSPKLIAFGARLNSARGGNASAQLEVAKQYLEGGLVPQSVNDALKWFTEAARLGEQEALAPLARLYLDPNNSFHDKTYGLALWAVADPSVARAAGPDFVVFTDTSRAASTPVEGLKRYLQLLEAGLLAPRIAQGLKDRSLVDKMLSPESVRKGFPMKAPLSADARNDKDALFARGVARYFGYGFPDADPKEAMSLIEEAACRRHADAFLMVALHYDTEKGYPSSEPTAWAFYGLARSLGSDNPFCLSRLSQFAETGVSVDWVGAPDALLAHVMQGRFTPALIRDLADLSLYRAMRQASPAPGAPNPFETAATQEIPLPKGQVMALARSMLNLKLRVVDASADDECVFRKCWDDGTKRFYSVSGVVTFINAQSRRETAPFTVVFRTSDAGSPTELFYCSAGSFLFGQCPPECGRRP